VVIDFVIPQEKSSVSASVNGQRAVVGYEGNIVLAPDSFDLRRVDVRINSTPKGVDIRRTREVTEYREVRIGDHPIALPVSSQFELQTRSGRRLRNMVKFGDCRRFSADSTIRFGDVPPQ